MNKNSKKLPLLIIGALVIVILIIGILISISRGENEDKKVIDNADVQSLQQEEKDQDYKSEPATPEIEPIPEPEVEPIPEPEIEPPPEPIPEPLPIDPEEEYLAFNGNQFNQLFNQANLPNLASLEDMPPPEITGKLEIDQRIRGIAERRGYRRRSEVLDRNQLVYVEGNLHLLQPQVAEAYLELKAAAAEANHHIHISSAFRDYNQQRRIFLNNAEEPYADEAVDEILQVISIPGYSKHHTGYAIDIGEGIFNFQDFVNSESYLWLVADNYLNAKKYGWIPSYPSDATNQGPNPEPWEFTYIGQEYLLEN